jgi:hypothetical protein
MPIVLFLVVGVGTRIFTNVALLSIQKALSGVLFGNKRFNFAYLPIPVTLLLTFCLNISSERSNFIETTLLKQGC